MAGYARHALIVRRLLYNATLFIPAASAVWALLPVLAAGNLGLGSAAYGVLLGMVGVGAATGAFVIPRLRARWGSARLVTAAMMATAGAQAVGAVLWGTLADRTTVTTPASPGGDVRARRAPASAGDLGRRCGARHPCRRRQPIGSPT